MESTKQFGKYLLIKLLGSGATSDVYLAHDTTLERDVALKMLKPALVSDQASFGRFQIEARAASKLFHDNIATVLDMGEVEGRFYIAMRYIEGKSLAQYLLDNGPLPWEGVKKLAQQIGSAISHAHDQGYIHRDIKPNNIMVDTKGNFVLTDFGLTRAMLESGMTSTTGAILGTPPYIPPEIWNGKEATPLSDQYSFACVINEAITGHSLFSGATTQEIITKHLVNKPEISGYPTEVPENVRFIIQKALSNKSSDRFQDITSFIKAILDPKSFHVASYLNHIDNQEKSVADKRNLDKIKARKKRRVISIITGIGVLFIVIVCAVGYLILKDRVSQLLSPSADPQIEQTQEILQLTIDSMAATSTANSLMQLTKVETPTQTLINTNTPTLTPRPTSTPEPTDAILPSAIPTIDTRPADTTPGSILSIGEVWNTKGFNVVLRDVTFAFGSEAYLQFTITNNTGGTLFFHVNSDSNTLLEDNNGKSYTWNSPYDYDIILENGDSYDLRIYKGGNFSGIQYLIITVDLPNLIYAQWKTN